MSLYDDSDPRHLAYREKWRGIGGRVSVALEHKAELLALLDCGVMRCATQASKRRYGALVSIGYATAEVDRFAGCAVADYRLTDRGRRVAEAIRGA